MKKRYLSRVFLLLLCAAVLLPLLPKAALASRPVDEIINVPVNCGSFSSGFLYEDSMVLADASQMSTDILKASAELAEAAYDSGKIDNCFSSMGFDLVARRNYDKSVGYTDNDVVAFSIGHKTVGDYNVYLIPIRGTHGNGEWYSDFNLGTGEWHAGFRTAADEVLTVIRETVTTNNNILWFTGHSRGAAVSNIVSGLLTDEGTLASGEHIFSYNFACPAVSTKSLPAYTNIWNFNNPGDLIPVLPLTGSGWGYTRYGQTRSLSQDDGIYANFKFQFRQNLGTEFSNVQNVQSYSTALLGLAPTKEDYYSGFNPFLFDMVAWGLGTKDLGELAQIVAKNSDPALVLTPLPITATKIFYDLSKGTAENVISLFPSKYRETLGKSTDLDVYLVETEELTNEEFTQWLSDNPSKVRKITEILGTTPTTRSEIVAYNTQLKYESAQNGPGTKLLSAWSSLSSYLFATDGDVLTNVTHGHQGDTYVLWVNSQFYGYHGWVNSSIEKNIVIPENIHNLGEWCFYNSSITGIDLPKGLEQVSPYAFYDCDNLTEVVVPNGVTSIGDYAFYSCDSLKSLTLPVDAVIAETKDNYSQYSSHVAASSPIEKIRYTPGATGVMADWVDGSIYTQHFYQRSLSWQVQGTLTEVIFDEGITHIGDYAFYGDSWDSSPQSKISKINLPSTLTSIGDYAFANQPQLQNVILPDAATNLGTYCFSGSGFSTIRFPKELETITEGLLSGCFNLTELVIPGSVTTIGDYAFTNCDSLPELIIPDSVTFIGDYAFCSCDSLKSLTLPVDAVISESYNGFHYSSNVATSSPIEKIRYTPGATGVMADWVDGSISTQHYYQESLSWQVQGTLTEVIFDEGITHIGDYAFRGDYWSNGKISKINLPSTLTSIGDYAFAYQQQLQNVILPDAATNLGTYCFSGSGFSTIRFPKELVTIPEGLLYGCFNLTELVIPGSVTTIGEHAFSDCDSLPELIIPDSVTFIEDCAFYSCDSLKSLTLPVDAVISESYNGSYYSSNVAAYSPIEKIRYTPGATGVMADWVSGSDTIQHSYYHSLAWQVVSTLTEVIFDEGITYIGDYAFCGDSWGSPHSKISKITLPSTLTSIGNYAFYQQPNLVQDIVLPDSTTSLGEYCFANSGIQSITLPEAITTVPYSMCRNCDNLTEVVVPNGVTSIGDYAFYHCNKLKSLTLPVDAAIAVTFNGSYYSSDVAAYSPIEKIHYTPGATGVMVDRVSTSGDHHYYRSLAWQVRNTLTEVVFDEGITHIGDYAFYGYKSNDSYGNYYGKISKITLPSTLTSIGDYAFYSQPSLASDIDVRGITEIGTNAFKSTPVTFWGKPGSYGEDYAIANEIPFFYLGTIILEAVPTEIAPGETYPLAGYIYPAIREKVTELSWSVDGALSEATNVSANGLLQIGEDETSSQITVTAAYGDCSATRELHIHHWSKPVRPENVSCEEEALVTVACGCGKTTEITIPAGQHTLEDLEGKEPSCTEDGISNGQKCSSCGKILQPQEPIPALGHTEVIDEAVEATCTETGLTEGKHCSVCGEVLLAQEEIPALGHTEVTDEAIDPTCTETGKTEGKHCSVCGEVLLAQEELPALGHTEVTDEAVEATCTETGLTEGKHCSICGEVLLAQEELPALGHTEVTDEAIDPTCAETGKTEGKHCSVCGEVLAAQEEVPALGHTEVIDEAVPPTCTETGLTEGKHCSVCGEVIVEQKIEDATGHTLVESGYQAPTCTENGISALVTCSVCGETIEEQQILPAGHKPVHKKLQKATTEEEGIQEHYECSGCGIYFTDKTGEVEANMADYKIPAVDIVRLSSTRYSYDGKTKTPKVGVYDSEGNKLVEDKDYTVTYAKGRKSVGQYNVTMKGIGDYEFRTTLTFQIVPPKSSIKSVTGKSKSFTASWSKKTSQVTGYQLQYSLDKNFETGVKTVTIKDNDVTSKTIKSLKSKKSYYVRIRTYKSVSGKNFYSGWSDAVKVKTK